MDSATRYTPALGKRTARARSTFHVPRSFGFTLLELLVAVAVFAVIAALAYGGLGSMLDAREHTRQAAQRLGNLQLAVSLLAGDIQQAVPRGVRDAHGDPLPALAGARDGIELTRAGHPNPTEAGRATIQRVGWGVEDGALVRWSWPVLDRVPGTRPAQRRLLEGLRELRLEYRVAGEWRNEWPGASPIAAPMPRAVRVTLELDDWGSVRRVVLLPEAARVRLPPGEDDDAP